MDLFHLRNSSGSLRGSLVRASVNHSNGSITSRSIEGESPKLLFQRIQHRRSAERPRPRPIQSVHRHRNCDSHVQVRVLAEEVAGVWEGRRETPAPLRPRRQKSTIDRSRFNETEVDQHQERHEPEPNQPNKHPFSTQKREGRRSSMSWGRANRSNGVCSFESGSVVQ